MEATTMQVPESSGQNLKPKQRSGLDLRIYQLVAGGGAGAITKTAVAPLERIKILLQIQGMKLVEAAPNGTPADLKYKGMIGTFRTVLLEEGFLALYKGNGANVLRVVPVYALKFTFNDFFRDIVKKDPHNKNERLSFTRLIISGTLAGLFQTCVTYPLETVRTRLSLGTGLGVHYNGIMDVFRTTIKTEGVAGLYKGIGPTFATGSPYVGLQMTSFEIFKRNQDKLDTILGVKQDNKKSHGLAIYNQVYKLSCGALAGIIAQTITYPGDTVRRRMQTNGMLGEERLYTNSIDCTKKIIKHEGFSKLYAGLVANIVRAIPGAAIQFWAYDLMKSLLHID